MTMPRPSDFLDQQVLPKLYDHLDTAFPEMGWKLKATAWVASNEQWSRQHHNCRPDRLYCYADSKHCYVVQGDTNSKTTWVATLAWS